MDLYIKSRFLTLRDRFEIYDGRGNACYYVVGELFSWGKRFHLYTMDDVEIATVRQKPISVMPKFYIQCRGMGQVEMVQRFAWLTPLYQLAPLGWTITGDFWRSRYTITDDYAMQVAEVCRDNLAYNAYHIHINDDRDAATVLCAMLVIDACIKQAAHD